MKRPLAITFVLLALALAALPAQAAKPGAAFVPNEVLVQFRDNTTDAQHQAARDRANGQQQEALFDQPNQAVKLEVVTLPDGADVNAAIAALEQDPSVEFAEPNWIYTTGATPNDPYYTDGSLWGMYGDASSPANRYGSQAAEAWAAGVTGSKTVYVGVIDQGIQWTHPDLDANVWTNPFDPQDGVDNDRNGYVDDMQGWDFNNNDNSVYDGGTRGRTDKHGTHVAGTIGAEGGNAAGVAGVNWNVTLISGKFIGRFGGTTAAAIRAIDYFTDLKQRHALNIVATNNSWGGGGYSQALYNAIARANRANILFIAAAGNNGTNNDTTPSYPANYDLPNVIAVAAIDKAGNLARFSQYGAATVDIGAPGVDVYSTLPNNTYGAYSGTSMAAPHVTGAAALYASTHPGANAAQIKAALLNSAIPTASLAGKTVTGGRLDAYGALSR